MSQIFISYARDGRHGEHLAIEVQQQLQAAGFTVFRDVIGLKPGDVGYSKLELELETCDVVVLVVSEKVRTSTWVHNEVNMAREIGKTVIPVFAEAIRLPLWLRHLQGLDFCENQPWKQLLDAIHPHLSEPLTEAASIKIAQLTEKTPLEIERVSQAPGWASHSGEDQYGRYADLDVKGVMQRFRWIEPGTFWMGSAEDEAERCNNETRHQVTLTQGYSG